MSEQIFIANFYRDFSINKFMKKHSTDEQGGGENVYEERIVKK